MVGLEQGNIVGCLAQCQAHSSAQLKVSTIIINLWHLFMTRGEGVWWTKTHSWPQLNLTDLIEERAVCPSVRQTQGLENPVQRQ